MPSTPLADAPYAVLDSAARAGDKALELHLPPLEPELYVRVKEALNRLNARWVKRRGTHVFVGTREEGEARLDLALRTRRLPDRNPLAFFPTPTALADEVARIVEEAFGWACGHRALRILEPHGGEGALLQALARALPSLDGFTVHVCELDPDRAEHLSAQGLEVVHGDYLTYEPDAPYDVIIANPPFSAPGDKQAWHTHLRRCWDQLAPEGLLIAILPGNAGAAKGGFFDAARGYPVSFRQLPAGSFKVSGTEVSTGLLVACKEDQGWKTRPFDACGTPYPSWYAFQACLTFENDETYYQDAQRLEERFRAGEDVQAPLRALYTRLCREARAFDLELCLTDADHAFLFQAFQDGVIDEKTAPDQMVPPPPWLDVSLGGVLTLQQDRGCQPALL